MRWVGWTQGENLLKSLKPNPFKFTQFWDLIRDKSIQIDGLSRKAQQQSQCCIWDSRSSNLEQDLLGTKGSFNEVDGSGWRRCRNRKWKVVWYPELVGGRRKQFLFVTGALDIEVCFAGVNSDILNSESPNARKALCTNIISYFLTIFIVITLTRRGRPIQSLPSS